MNNIIPFELLEGGVHSTAPVDEVPEIELARWAVFQLPDGDRHFVGWNLTEGDGRASSKIVSYNKETKIGKTASGRTYKLIGESGIDMDALYVWSYWKIINNVSDEKNVSEEYE